MTGKLNDESGNGFSWAWKILTGIVAVSAVLITQLLDFTFSIENYSIAFSLFWRELLALITIATAFFVLLAMSRRVIASVKYAHSSGSAGHKARLYLAFFMAFIVISSSVTVTAYQGRKLLLGNLIQYRQAHGIYLIDAQEDFNQGNYSDAYLEVETCVTILKRDRCKEVLNALDARRSLVVKATELINNNALDLDGKFTLLRDLSQISGTDELLIDFHRQMKLKFDEAFIKYTKALELVKLGKIDGAIAKLNEVHGEWTDFGHNRFLHGELVEINQLGDADSFASFWDAIKQKNDYPYLSALQRMGVTEYAAYTAKTSTLAL